MLIRKMVETDLPQCAKILCSVYNNEMWQCKWQEDTAEAYLRDFFDMNKFLGYVLCDENHIVGAILAHEKIWWNNSEVYVEEMFIYPELQHQGYGRSLITKIEEYVREKELAGITLATNRYAPAPAFYRKNGFKDAEHVLYMYKEVSAE